MRAKRRSALLGAGRYQWPGIPLIRVGVLTSTLVWGLGGRGTRSEDLGQAGNMQSLTTFYRGSGGRGMSSTLDRGCSGWAPGPSPPPPPLPPGWVGLPASSCGSAGPSGRPGWRLPHQPVGAGGREQMGGGRTASLLQQPPRHEEAGPQPLRPKPAAGRSRPGPPQPAALANSASPAGGNGAGASQNANELRGLLGCVGVSGPQFPRSNPRAGSQMVPNSERHRGLRGVLRAPASGARPPRLLPGGQGASARRPFSGSRHFLFRRSVRRATGGASPSW